MLKIYFLHKSFLQVLGVKLHIANLLDHHLLHLVAVLLGLLPAALHRRVAADQPLLQVTDRLDGLLLALVADLPGLLLAVLGVAVLLGLLRASLHFKLADFLGLEMAVLLLDREGEDVGEFLTVPVDISLANLDLDLAGNVVAALCRLPCTDNSLRSITIVLGALVPLAVELHGVSAGHVVDHLFFHVAVGGLNIRTLVIVLGGHIDLVGGVAHSVLPCEAPLDLVSLLQCLVVDCLNQIADKLIYVETNTLDLGLDNPSTVVEKPGNARLLILGVAGPLGVRLALVLEHHLLHHVAVGVLVDTVSPNIGLPYVRIIPLGGCRRWVHRRWWSSHHSRQASQVDQVNHVVEMSS